MLQSFSQIYICLIVALFIPYSPNRKEKRNMELNKTFKITFWAKKHKKHITRNAKWTELCRYFTSKSGTPCITYYTKFLLTRKRPDSKSQTITNVKIVTQVYR